MKLLKRNIDIIIIVVIGFILRLTIAGTHSYSNDELSAITRLKFNNFSEMIEFGVMKGDMHPAGVQVFMKFWSGIAGVHELGMRLPFVIFGCISIILIFSIGKKYINREAGLFAAAFLSLLYFPIMNSEFARPYSPGLMFSLLSAWFYLKIIFNENRSLRDAILLGVSVAAAMYTHYFAFMFVGWMGISSFIFIKKDSLKYLLIGAGLAILLFLPHFSVTQYHLSVEGGLGWLKAPGKWWLWEFIVYAFNSSWFVLIAIALSLILSLILRQETKLQVKPIFLFATWFFGIFFVAFLFSILKTPILKFPVMLFAFPFLLLMISALLSRFKYQGVLMAVVMTVIGISTIKEKDLFENNHYELFRELAHDMVRWDDTYGKENVYTVMNVNDPDYLNFYANQWNKSVEIDWHEVEYGDDPAIREDLLSRRENYCVVGFSGRTTDVQVFEVCHEFYPYILEKHKYNNCSIMLLARWPPGKDLQDSERIAVFNPIGVNEDWTYDPNKLKAKGDDSTSRFLTSYVLDAVNPFGPEYYLNVSDIPDSKNEYVYVEVFADASPEIQLTAAVSGLRGDKEVMDGDQNWWYGKDLERMIATSGKGYLAFKLPPFIEEQDRLKISLWNRNPEVPCRIGRVNIYIKENIWN